MFVESNAQTCLKRLSPFNSETGKLKKNALLYSKPGVHPLLVAANKEYLNLMQHDLTETYMTHKWYSYMWIILFLTVLCEAVLVIFLGLYLNYVRYFENFMFCTIHTLVLLEINLNGFVIYNVQI